MLFVHRLTLAVCCLGAATSLPLRPVSAQSSLPVCPAPSSGEFLLVVRGDSEAERAQIASILPVESPVLVCRYLDEVVVRAGGFTSLETANAWASYMSSVEDFESFVLRPANSSTVAASGETTGSIAYQPQLLGPGYAVLVDYGNRPEVATAVGQLVQPVGLAVYQQKAYLLAGYSADPAIAADTLQRLSNAQLTAVLVDAQQVVRLSSEVAR